MSVMVGSVTESMVVDETVQQNTNSTEEARVPLASTLSVLVGLFQVRGAFGYEPHPIPGAGACLCPPALSLHLSLLIAFVLGHPYLP